MISAAARPALARKVQLRFDRHSQQHMLVYPDHGMLLSGSAYAIVELCTGTLSVVEIVDRLHSQCPGASRDVMAHDVHTLLEALLDRGLLRIHDEHTP